jgi:hypothetical protein
MHNAEWLFPQPGSRRTRGPRQVIFACWGEGTGLRRWGGSKSHLSPGLLEHVNWRTALEWDRECGSCHSGFRMAALKEKMTGAAHTISWSVRPAQTPRAQPIGCALTFSSGKLRPTGGKGVSRVHYKFEPRLPGWNIVEDVHSTVDFLSFLLFNSRRTLDGYRF